MKRLGAVLLPALLGTALASPVLGQTKVAGAKVGIVFADIDTNVYDGVDITTNASTSISAGLYFGVDLHRRFRLQLEAQYIRKGMDVSTASVEGTISGEFNLDYLELLLPATFMIPVEGGSLVPRLYVGPAVGFELSCNVVTEASGITYRRDCSNQSWGTQAVQFGVFIGGGSDLRIGSGVLSLDVIYDISLTDTHLNPDEAYTQSGLSKLFAKNRSLQVMAGYGIVIG